MTFDEVLSHYGSVKAIANAIGGVSSQAISQWKTSGKVPPLRQVQIQGLTGGKLVADPDVFERSKPEAA